MTLVALQYQPLLTSSKCAQLFQQFFQEKRPCNSEIYSYVKLFDSRRVFFSVQRNFKKYMYMGKIWRLYKTKKIESEEIIMGEFKEPLLCNHPLESVTTALTLVSQVGQLVTDN